MALTIVTYPAKVLSRPARRVKAGDVDLRQLFQDMCDAMTDYVGVGLAAPQVDLSIRFIVVEDRETGLRRGFANPQIIESSSEQQIGPEGCLSFPGLWGEVIRHTRITVRYQDLDFVEHEEEFEGYFARVLQHEIDHLNGVLLVDRAEDGLHEAVSEDEEDDEDADGEEHQPRSAPAPISPGEAP
jgi:peptide deformylase